MEDDRDTKNKKSKDPSEILCRKEKITKNALDYLETKISII
jgi:hypothetical protein